MALISLNLGSASSSGLGTSGAPVASRYRGTRQRGGLINAITGAGTAQDKLRGAEFYPSYYHPVELEIIYAESWAARKFVDIIPNDMGSRWREFDASDSKAREAMKEQERRLKVRKQLLRAVRGARLFGTSMIVIMGREQDLTIPLTPDELREGEITSLPVFHRHQCRIASWITDPRDVEYGRPAVYYIQPVIAFQALLASLGLQGANLQQQPDPRLQSEGGFPVHHTRILRFDGIEPLTNEGWEGAYERDWGISELGAALETVIQQASVMQSTTQQVQEDDIETISIQGWREAVVGQTGPDDPSIQQIGMAHNMQKSQFRTRYIDANDNVFRTPINFSGRPQLIDQYHALLAAIAGVPHTRFMSQSPAGMNATGKSDMSNWALTIQAHQENLLGEPLHFLDQVLARNVGLQEPPSYSWMPLFPLSEQEQAELSFKKAEVGSLMYDRSAMTEDEFRELMSGDAIVGDLGPMSPEDLEEMRLQQNPPSASPQEGEDNQGE